MYFPNPIEGSCGLCSAEDYAGTCSEQHAASEATGKRKGAAHQYRPAENRNVDLSSLISISKVNVTLDNMNSRIHHYDHNK
ncbi:hypothetical protein [Paenibacillus taiwanensis]|uniref:hypothetical protein n=1 Tax=Paenibacillus taiwanensis TaxID=401638 RepID=UPI0012FAED9C|nr:hypothetical protein [Paenibacillus taiwanensis]